MNIGHELLNALDELSTAKDLARASEMATGYALQGSRIEGQAICASLEAAIDRLQAGMQILRNVKEGLK